MKKIYFLSASFSGKIQCFCLLLLFVTFIGCATQYRHVEPHTMEYSAMPDTLHSCNVEITYRYDILANASNKKYARKEKKEGISLIAVRIANNGNDTLFIPDDILIEARDNWVFPLDMNEAIDVFIQDHPAALDELMGGAVEVGGVFVPGGWGFLVPLATSIPSTINSSIEAKANDRFIKEMQDYYLVFSNVPPGATVSGLLALPVELFTPLTFSKN